MPRPPISPSTEERGFCKLGVPKGAPEIYNTFLKSMPNCLERQTSNLNKRSIGLIFVSRISVSYCGAKAYPNRYSRSQSGNPRNSQIPSSLAALLLLWLHLVVWSGQSQRSTGLIRAMWFYSVRNLKKSTWGPVFGCVSLEKNSLSLWTGQRAILSEINPRQPNF